MSFQPDVRDLSFWLSNLPDARKLTALREDFDTDTIGAVLEAAGEFAAGVLAPLDRVGDTAEVRLENDNVYTVPGWKEAYEAYCEGGWGGLSGGEAYGGQDLAKALDTAVGELMTAANASFLLCPVLSSSAASAILAAGSDVQKALYIPRMLSGEWAGSMQLTEPGAGSDLGLIRTRAEPQGDGRYKLYGEKIFITYGDHDMADNIVHLVLARLPDAPAGSRGISLFLANKYAVSSDGSLGARNAMRPLGVEHKLGLHASPTCVMGLEGADADLIGTENQGLAHMFVMMNAARLKVGAQGVAVAERAFQRARAFAAERLQGRSAWTGVQPTPIVDHPDVRRMLAVSQAKVQAARAICLTTALAADIAKASPDPDVQKAYRLREELLTPIAKAWSTDVAVEVASLGVQVHGGMGFIEETGAAQHYRDARILPIYEGTNGIQANDLIGRKLGMDGGSALTALLGEVRETIAALRQTAGLDRLASRLETAVDATGHAAAWLAVRPGQAESLAGAVAFQTLFGDLVGGWLLAHAALVDPARAPLARFFGDQILVHAAAHAAQAVAGDADLKEIAAA